MREGESDACEGKGGARGSQGQDLNQDVWKVDGRETEPGVGRRARQAGAGS